MTNLKLTGIPRPLVMTLSLATLGGHVWADNHDMSGSGTDGAGMNGRSMLMMDPARGRELFAEKGRPRGKLHQCG